MSGAPSHRLVTYGELAYSRPYARKVLFFTHVCHPSTRQRNTSGMSVATALGSGLRVSRVASLIVSYLRRGTIGRSPWLKRNEPRLCACATAWSCACWVIRRTDLQAQPPRHERDRRGRSYVLAAQGTAVPFSPYGYRRAAAVLAGFDLPVGRLTRSVNSGYPQYHTSADDLSLIYSRVPDGARGLPAHVEVIEINRPLPHLSLRARPQARRRGLFLVPSGASARRARHAMLGSESVRRRHSLLDIARNPACRLRHYAKAGGASGRGAARAARARSARRHPPRKKRVWRNESRTVLRGFGTRLREHSDTIPEALVNIR